VSNSRRSGRDSREGIHDDYERLDGVEPILHLTQLDLEEDESRGADDQQSLNDQISSRQKQQNSSHGHSPARSSSHSPHRGTTISPSGVGRGGRGAGTQLSNKDIQLPMFPFTAGKEYANENNHNNHEKQKKHSKINSPSRDSMTSSQRRHENLRTDKNEKAKYLPPSKGKFRKEFSLDHPLAPKGSGKYTKELKQGLKPIGMDLPQSTTAGANLEKTLQITEKVEKLTKVALLPTVDNDDSIKELQDSLSKELAKLVEEERIAEKTRQEAIRNFTDSYERMKLEEVFAEERLRASDRIIQATKEHDHTIRNAMLKSLNLKGM
jgi:hypothetical protein